MNAYKVLVEVDPKSAALEGFDFFGDIAVEVKPSELSVRQRQALASLETKKYGEFSFPYISLPNIGVALPESIPVLLEMVADNISNKVIKKESIVDKAIEELLTLRVPAYSTYSHAGIIHIVNQCLVVKAADSSFIAVDIFTLVGGLSSSQKTELLNDSRIVDLLDFANNEANRLNLIQDESVSRYKDSMKNLQKLEIENIYNSAIELWTRDLASDIQKAQVSRKMISNEEIINIIRNDAFDSLSEFKKFNRITKSETSYGYFSSFDEYIGFSSHEILECSEREFKILYSIEQKIHEFYPDAKCSIHYHSGYNTNFGTSKEQPYIIRHSVKVELVYLGVSFSREYAID